MIPVEETDLNAENEEVIFGQPTAAPSSLEASAFYGPWQDCVVDPNEICENGVAEGTQTRAVLCVDDELNKLDASLCDPREMDDISRICDGACQACVACSPGEEVAEQCTYQNQFGARNPKCLKMSLFALRVIFANSC